MKIWIIKSGWDYNGCPDTYTNCHEETIKKIFDSEEKAIKYIQDQLRPMVEHRSAVLAAYTDANRCECCVEKNCKDCIVCSDFIDLDEVPSEEFIKDHKDEIVYLEEHNETSYYCYEEFEVE